MCLTVGRQSRDHRPLSRDPSVSFYKKFLNCLKRPKTLFDSQPTVAWPPTTVAWPFSDFFQNFPKSLESSKKRCLTVGRWSRDLRPLSRDRSATFSKKNSNCLKRQKIVVWQSADSRVTSDHCRVTVQRPFSKKFLIAWNVQKTLFDSRPTVAWPQPLSRDRSATFFKIVPNCLKRPKNVVWQSADGRVTSEHCRVTVQRPFPKKFLITRNVEKSLFDSRPTAAWPPTTVAWPFSDFISKFSQIAWNVQKTLFDSRPTVAWPPNTVAWPFSVCLKKISNCLKRPKNVVWQSADGRVTSDHCRVTVQPLFQNFPKLLDTSKNRCLTVGRQSRDLRPLSRDRSATFFKNFLFTWKVEKTLFDSRPMVAWPPTTLAWPFSDFFQNFPKLLETSKKRCLTVSRRSRDLRPLSRDRSTTFFKYFSNCLKRLKNVVWQSADGRVTSDYSRTASHTASQMYLSLFLLLSRSRTSFGTTFSVYNARTGQHSKIMILTTIISLKR